MHRNVTGRICSRAFRGAAAAALLIGLVGGTAQAQSIDVGDAEGTAGSTITFDVSWTAGDSGASGLTVDVGFGDHPIDVGTNNRPACTYSSAVTAAKEASSFSFRPPQCTVGETCEAFRAGIISFNPDNNALPVPEGVLYSCAFTIPEDADEGDEFAFDVAFASFIVPSGAETEITETSDGVVRVVVQTPTPTATDTPAATNTPTATNTLPPPTATPTRGGGGDDDDGCQVVAPADASSAWLLLFPAAVLVWRRRRAR